MFERWWRGEGHAGERREGDKELAARSGGLFMDEEWEWVMRERSQSCLCSSFSFFFF